jgi:ammonium transporter, Amt family
LGSLLLLLGAGGNGFIGGTALMALPSDNIAPNDYIYWYFNYVFAGTTATIVSGAVAERCQFRAYLCYSFALAGFIYPVCSHWIWSPDGFLNGVVYDFAGGGAVHMVGGVAAGTASYFLGPRVGRFAVDPDTGKTYAVKIPGHNQTLAALGALVLWFGFFAFNGGSSYTIAGEAQYIAVGRAVVVTTLGGAAGAFTLMFWGYLATHTWDMSYVINGLLAGMVRTALPCRFETLRVGEFTFLTRNGLFIIVDVIAQVAVCSGANAIDPWASILVGILGAAATQLQIIAFENYLFIDDPLNASAVHFAAGGVSMLFPAFMANPDYTGEDKAGIFYGGEWKFLGHQMYGMVVYSVWTLGTSGLLFFALNQMGWFRVSEQEELVGVDVSHHGGKAYPLDDLQMLAGVVTDSSSPGGSSTTSETMMKHSEPTVFRSDTAAAVVVDRYEKPEELTI